MTTKAPSHQHNRRRPARFADRERSRLIAAVLITLALLAFLLANAPKEADQGTRTITTLVRG